MFVAHPPYLRAKARELRTKNKMSLDEIAECLALGKTTVWYWISDLPDPAIKLRDSAGRRRGREAASRANRERAKAKRDLAYRQGWCEFAVLDAEPGFRDFVCMYIGEGYKRSRNAVAICNSDPNVICLGEFWIRRFASNPVTYSLQYHVDQDLARLRHAWADLLDIEEDIIRVQRKSNSNQLTGRNWRSRLGVMTIASSDTYFRARLQAWIDRTMSQWLDSIDRGV